MRHIILILAIALVTPALRAQPLVSPEVHADRTVTFRFRAPAAKEVIVRSEALAKDLPLQKDGQGVWSATTEPLAPDIYVYACSVDGQRVLDPSNPFIKYNLFSSQNQVHVPGPKDLPWEINDVPHGTLHRQLYHSAIIGDDLDAWIYTPPGYNAAAKTRYPVLYLLHGYSDAEDSWVTIGRTHVILDNLIARGLAKPMLIVMPHGYGNREIMAGSGAMRGGDGQRIYGESQAKFRESLFNEIIPLIERSYRVSADRSARALAGLSMGGSQTLQFGLLAPDRFAWIASMGAGGLSGGFDQVFTGVDSRLNAQLRLLWVGCGTEDSLIGNNRALHEWLAARDIRHIWVETPGRHSFTLWRRYLAQLTPLLFQEVKPPQP